MFLLGLGVVAINNASARREQLIATLCSAETPATDSIWFRVRDEQTTLVKLVSFDVSLSQRADRAKAAAEALDVAAFDDTSLDALGSELDALEHAFDARRSLIRG